MRGYALTSENIDLNPQFLRALEIMEEGRSHLFITGKAGTGKSTLLTYFRQQSAWSPVVLAPTGVASVNVGGQTIHSVFGFKPDGTASYGGGDALQRPSLYGPGGLLFHAPGKAGVQHR